MKVIDLHCDTVLELMGHDTSLSKNNLSVDIEKMKKASYMGQFFALFVHMEDNKDPYDKCMEMLKRFYAEIENNRNEIAHAGTYEDLLRNVQESKISAFLTIEEGGVLKGSMENLIRFYELGVRLITLTWNFPNEIGYPNYNFKYADQGLADFGKELIGEMNRLHMLIDVSHLSDGGFYDVAKYSKSPFVASHSNARAVTNHSRNLTDDMIKILSNSGGVMGINFCSAFLGTSKISRISDMIEHIKHIHKVGGIDVIGLGSDFDGIGNEVEIRDCSQMEMLAFELRKNGFKEDDIEKIFYKNAERIVREVL